MIKTNKTLVIAIIVLITCFVQMVLSSDLWLPTDREFPLIPFFESLPLLLNHGVRLALIIAMLFTLVLIILFPKRRKLLLIFSCAALIFVLEDVMRFQPWFYMHLVMTLILAFEKELSYQKVLLYMQFIVIAIYFWGGFNKLNLAFAWEIFPWLIQPFDHNKIFFLGYHNLNSFPLPATNYVAFIIPVIEILLALFLTVPRFRVLGISLCVLTHIFSLLAIGPFGQNWNTVVWPWNVQMPLLCFVLFFNVKQENFVSILVNAMKSRIGAILLFLFLIVPILSFLGKWDKGMALHLYSGNSTQMEFHFEGFQEHLTKSSFAPFISMDTTTMTSFMKVSNWSADQFNAPIYSSIRHLKKVGSYLCNCLEKKDNSKILIITRNGFLSKQDSIIVSCQE